jgi:hypothetical protein
MAKVNILKSIKKALSSIGLTRCKTMRRRKSVQKRSRKVKKSRQSGGGYSEQLDLSIYPGQQVHAPYTGSGYDCAGSPARPGTLDTIGMLRNPGGLPGLSPTIMSGGASQLGSGGIVLGQNGKKINGGRRRKNQKGGTVLGVSVADGSIPGTPSSGTPAPVVLQESQVPANVNASQQKGGRYGMEMQPAALILSPSNAVGMSGYAQNGVVPCERGTTDALNADPTLQSLTTYPNTVGVANMTQVMRGGKRMPVHKKSKKANKKSQNGGKKKSLKRQTKQKGGVVVGQVDAMRYYAPTAGYDNLPLTPAVPNNPGILMQVGYPAGHFNPACMKTN